MTDHTLETLRAEWAQPWASPTPSCPVLLPLCGPALRSHLLREPPRCTGRTPGFPVSSAQLVVRGFVPTPSAVSCPLPPPFLSPVLFSQLYGGVIDK